MHNGPCSPAAAWHSGFLDRAQSLVVAFMHTGEPTMPSLRPTLAGFAACLLLSACAHEPAAQAHRPTHSRPAPAAAAANASAPAAETARKESEETLPAHTGIQACDDYLASYRACHRAAAIYKPDQIESHYQQMRQSLLRDSLRPEIRPQLGARCNSLARSLRQALHGKACEPDPATASSTTH